MEEAKFSVIVEYSVSNSESSTLRLGSKVARLKLKGIGSRGGQRWNMRFISIQREKPYPSLHKSKFLYKIFLYTSFNKEQRMDALALKQKKTLYRRNASYFRVKERFL